MKYPKYVKTSDGYIGTFQYLEFGEFPVYRFEGGDRIADNWELANGSDNREELVEPNLQYKHSQGNKIKLNKKEKRR